jgi:preprotein translocase subunit YajC
LNFAVFAFQNVPPAPGRDTPSAPIAHTEQPAHSGDSAPGQGGIFGFMFPLLLVGMLVFIFFSSRSQNKKQEATLSSLKKGDRVLTQSGLVGRLVEIEPRYAKLEIAPGVKVQVLRTSISGRDTDEATTSKDKDKPESLPEKK